LLAVGSAVNYIGIANNTTGNRPLISVGGSDSNIQLQLIGKGTGGVLVQGRGTTSSPDAGYIGEFFSSVVAAASGVTVASATATNITTISLTAGDWDVWGNITMAASGTTNVAMYGWVSSSSATLPDDSLFSGLNITVINVSTGFCVPQQRFGLSGAATIYLSAYQNSSGGTTKVSGGIYARRVS